MVRKREKPLISVVCPVCNNAAQLQQLFQEISQAVAGCQCEMLFVDDRSSDESWQIIHDLAARKYGLIRVRALRLSRNYGQHSAIHAGLAHARGDFVIVLDADLQDNPAYIPQLLDKANQGFDIVHTRRKKAPLTWQKLLSIIAHKILTRDSEIVMHGAMGNYKLLSRRAVDAALCQRLDRPIFELMVAYAGFSAGTVEVVRRQRPGEGSAYTMGKSFRLFFGLMLSYSSLVFKLSIFAGVFSFAAAVISLIIFASSQSMAGLIFFAALFVTGCVLCAGGILGYYVRTLQKSSRTTPVIVVEEEI